MIMSDSWIREQATEHGMITPFQELQRGRGVISYGLSSYGYDARVGHSFTVFEGSSEGKIDPKNIRTSNYTQVAIEDGGSLTLPAHGFALACTIETFKMPRDVLAICMGKSTYARCGIVIGVTPLEPEWEGQVTIEISNTTPLPAQIYAGEGICQFLFFKGDRPCEVSYADRVGKYMHQQGVTLPKVL